MKTHFPNPEDLLNFELTIQPDEGQSPPSLTLCSVRVPLVRQEAELAD